MLYLAIGCRSLLAAVFAVAVAGKLRNREAFAEFVRSIQRMAIVAPSLTRPAAIISVGAEIVVALLLVTPAPGPGAAGFALAAGLLVVFTVVIVGSLRRGTTVPCRCFGRSEIPLGRRHVLRNALLVAVAAAGLLASLPGAAVDAGPAVVATVTGGVLGALVTVLDDIVYLVAPAPPDSGPRRDGAR
ncbi:MauE/DoxX family redox-associated membrane protein [Micromonospora sp. NPDC007230]|uniref:MauE/DoxX family redox-associated membrane protein n=1 Tax=Micromonospora sp. NPDC007230 TaxID=3364237 RepID=UPI0036948A28